MIAEFFVGIFFKVIDWLTFFDIPNLPPEVFDYVEQAFVYISAGAGFLANYVPLGYLLTLFTIILAIDGAVMLYHFVMWILAKIPVFKIDR